MAKQRSRRVRVHEPKPYTNRKGECVDASVCPLRCTRPGNDFESACVVSIVERMLDIRFVFEKGDDHA